MSRKKCNEDGYVLVVVAGVLIILLGFAALAVDVGMIYGAHTSAQRAADAAALGGAYTFVSSPTAIDPVTLAQTQATNTAVQNTILGAPIDSSEVTVNVDLPNHLVTVNLSHTIPTFFAGVLGSKFATVSVVAHAEVLKNDPCGGDCMKPWFVPNNILSILKPCPALPPLPPGNNACSQEQLLVRFDPVARRATVTQFALDWMAQVPAVPFTIKPGNPSAALGPGQFFAIQLTSATGAAVYEEHIATCAPHVVCGDSYSVETGDMIGPTKQGVARLITFDNCQTAGCIPTYADTWAGFDANGVAHFTSPSGVDKITSHQVVVTPIWDVCGTICTTGGKLTGTNVQIQIIGFATIFLADIQGNDVIAYLLGVQGCDLNSTGGCDGSAVLTFPLRLVRTN